jgi:hypothetical protein
MKTVLSKKVEQRFKVEDLSLTLSPLTLNPFTSFPFAGGELCLI